MEVARVEVKLRAGIAPDRSWTLPRVGSRRPSLWISLMYLVDHGVADTQQDGQIQLREQGALIEGFVDRVASCAGRRR